jgi:hypothetical protein
MGELARTGETFCQAESYDHWVRDDAEWQRIAACIKENPVKTGLMPCASAEDRASETCTLNWLVSIWALQHHDAELYDEAKGEAMPSEAQTHDRDSCQA